MIKRVLMCCMAIAILLVPTYQAFADDEYPNKPIMIIVAFSPGSGGDLAARILADKWTEFLRQPIIVENKTGAMGAVGTRFVARSEPDGYTLLLTGNSQLISGRLFTKDPGFDLDSFRFLFNFAKNTLFISVKGDSKWKTLNDLFTEARNNPGKLKYSTMLNRPADLTAQMLFKSAGVKLTPIPFDSSSECLTAVAGGNADVSVSLGLGGMGKSGMLRPLATSDEARLPNYPDLPSLRELGYQLKHSVTQSENGIAGPAKMPEKVVAKLIETYNKTRAKYDNDIKEKLIKIEQYPTNVDGKKALQQLQENDKEFREFLRITKKAN